MRKQAIIPLAVGLVVGLIALKLGYDHLCRLEQANSRTGPTEKILVATRDIPVAVNLTVQDVKLVDMPKQFVPEGVLVDPKKVIGKSLKVSTAKRMPILASMVHTGKGFGGVIPEGYRAVSVKVDEYSGVAGFLQPGAFVDVVGTFKLRQDDTGITHTISKIVLQGVEVRAVGQKFREDVGGKEVDLVRSVTLLVKPDDVERLQLASSSGKIRLALRAPLDLGHKVTSGVTMATLLREDDQFQQGGSTAGSLAGGFWDLFSNKSGNTQDFAMTSSTEGQPYLVELISPEKIENIYFESAHSRKRIKVDKLPSENSDNANNMQSSFSGSRDQ